MKHVKAPLIFSLIYFLTYLAAFSAYASVSISSYEATFKVITNAKGEHRDIQAELTITYRIQGELKTGGMKLVEAPSLDAVEVTDGGGNSLPFHVVPSGKRYNKIIWSFPRTNESEQRVIIRFTIPGAVATVGGKGYFKAYWVGSWVVPVDKALYRFIFPAGYSYQECSIYPRYEFSERVVGEERQIEVSITPLKGESFALAFSPCFSEWKGTGKGAGGGSDTNTSLSKKDESGNVIEQVRGGTHDSFSRIVFKLRKETDYHAVAAPQNNSITISIPHCMVGPQARSGEYNDALIKQLELSEEPGGQVVARIGLTERGSSFTHTLMSNPPRIIVNVMPVQKMQEKEERASEQNERGGKVSENGGKVSGEVTTPVEVERKDEGAPGEVKGKVKGEGVEGEVKEEEIGETAIPEEVKETEIKEEIKEVQPAAIEGKAIALAPSPTTSYEALSTKEPQAASAEERRIYDSALELYQQGKYHEALSNLRLLINQSPRSDLADAVSFLIGECYFSLAREGILKSYQPAIDAFELALALYPDSEHVPGGLFQLANSYREMHYHYEADGNYRLLLEKYPHAQYSADVHFWMGENLYQGGEFGKAKDQFQKFMLNYPQADTLQLKRAAFRFADCYVGLKDYTRAQKGYEEALNRWPTYDGLFPENLFNMGLTYLENGDYRKARSILFMVFNVFTDQDFTHIVLTKVGDTYKMEGKIEDALKVYSQNTLLYPGSKGALISEMKMADIGVKNPGFFNFDQYLDPLKVYQRIIEKYPTTEIAEEALYKQGVAFSEQKRYQDAIASLLTVLEEYPDSDLSKRCFISIQETLCKLIDSYASEENYGAILELYQKRKTPFLSDVKNTKALFQIGESFRQVGLYDEALEIYGKAQRIYPRTHPEDELILRMGEVYVLKKAYGEAEELFKKLIERCSESTCRKLAFHDLADTYFAQGQYEAAQLAYRSALKEEGKIPRDIRGLFYLGKCYHAMGNLSSSIDAYREALRVAEQLGKSGGEQEFVIESSFQLADELYQNQQYLDAASVYTQAVERYPEDDRAQWALYRIAASYRKAGKGASEIESLKKLVSKGIREPFWEKVIAESISNIEWETKNRAQVVP